LDHVQQAGRACLVPDRGQVDDDGQVLVAAPGVPPHVLIHADDLHPIEAVRILDQDPASFGQDGVVRGVPRHPEGFGDPSDREVPAHQAERPLQPATRQPCPRLRGPASVLPPHPAAARTPVAAHRDQQQRGPPAHRFVRQPAEHGVPRRALLTAPPAGLIGGGDPARQDRTIRLQELAHDL